MISRSRIPYYSFNVLACELSLHRNEVQYEIIGINLEYVMESVPIYQDVHTLRGLNQ